MTKLLGFVLGAAVMWAAPRVAAAGPGSDDYYGGDYAGPGGPAPGDDGAAGPTDRADRAERRAQRQQMRDIRQRIKARFDADHDGRLSRDERRAARHVIGKRMAMMKTKHKLKMFRRAIRKFDANGDGVVGPGELPDHLVRKLRKFDRDGDGWITADDLRGRGR